MNSAYYKAEMERIKKEKEEYVILLGQLGGIDFSGISSVLDETDKYLEHVAPNGVAFDEGKFDKCISSLNSFSGSFSTLISECQQKINQLKGDYDTARANYYRLLSEENMLSLNKTPKGRGGKENFRTDSIM